MLQFFQILEKFSIKKSRKKKIFDFKKNFFHFLCIVEISIWEHLKIVLEHQKTFSDLMWRCSRHLDPKHKMLRNYAKSCLYVITKKNLEVQKFIKFLLSLKIMKNHQKWKKNVKIVKSNFRRPRKKNFSPFGPLSFLDLVEGGAV